MLRDFIAIDFETANQQPSSVCSVGVVMVRDGQMADSFYSLIQPEPNYYNGLDMQQLNENKQRFLQEIEPKWIEEAKKNGKLIEI